MPGALAHSQGFGAEWGSKGSPDWAETPPLRSRADRQKKKKKSNHARPSGKLKTKEKERKEGRDSRVSGVRVDGKHAFKDNEDMTDSPEIIMLTET